MKIFQLKGFVPDFCEQCMMNVAKIFTDKQLAIQELNKMKKHIIEVLQADAADAITSFRTNEIHHYGETPIIATCAINVLCNPEQQQHREMLMNFSGFSHSDLRATDVSFNTSRIFYQIAEIEIRTEEINL